MAAGDATELTQAQHDFIQDAIGASQYAHTLDLEHRAHVASTRDTIIAHDRAAKANDAVAPLNPHGGHHAQAAKHRARVKALRGR